MNEEIKNINPGTVAGTGLSEPVFEKLEDKMNYYRKLAEHRIPKKSYVLIMLDGRAFSKGIKNRFKKPFDRDFINMMDETAAYVCHEVQGAKFAYVQSDEISVFVTDINDKTEDGNETTMFFDGRMSKMLSVVSGLATSFFNRRMHGFIIEKFSESHPDSLTPELISEELNRWPYYHFDAKVWSVPTRDIPFQWFLWRQNDCIRNSKQQAAQTYISHNRLKNKHVDVQVQMLLEQEGIDWNRDYSDGEKYGRFIYKESEPHARELNGEKITYDRTVWKAHEWPHPLNTPEGREIFNAVLGPMIPEKPKQEIIISDWFISKVRMFRNHIEDMLHNMRIMSDLDDSTVTKDIPLSAGEFINENFNKLTEISDSCSEYLAFDNENIKYPNN